jgi:hypothetical protein
MSAADRAVSAKRLTYWVVLGCIPAFVLGLWLASGRSVWTQHQRYVSVTVTDELFGGETQTQEAVSGPILGYYVGLDMVVAAALLPAAIAATVALVRLLARRRLIGKGNP